MKKYVRGTSWLQRRNKNVSVPGTNYNLRGDKKLVHRTIHDHKEGIQKIFYETI
jgi:hypothetical protein